jgi:catechol 2,3-dioxygenase-like lactoylglutathione lyase family enzyme
MIDHVSIQVRDLAASSAFYDAVLAPLGGRRLMEDEDVLGYGTDQPDFWLAPMEEPEQSVEMHIAFRAESREAVRAFHAAAAAAGAETLHEPKLWPEYHETYYAAFVRDPDGHNVEAVCHAAQE